MSMILKLIRVETSVLASLLGGTTGIVPFLYYEELRAFVASAAASGEGLVVYCS